MEEGSYNELAALTSRRQGLHLPGDITERRHLGVWFADAWVRECGLSKPMTQGLLRSFNLARGTDRVRDLKRSLGQRQVVIRLAKDRLTMMLAGGCPEGNLGAELYRDCP